MKLRETPLAGAFIIEHERLEDNRGYFARTFCQKELGAAGLFQRIAQCNVSFNLHAGTLRGLHFQADPHAEEKIISCTSGAIFDVMVDLRPRSSTFGTYFSQQLTPDCALALYVPKGFAHGFQTLVADTTVFYLMSEFHEQGATAGVRWDDPEVGIPWPMEPRMMSARDLKLPTINDWLQSKSANAR